jgi:hypothetical protein
VKPCYFCGDDPGCSHAAKPIEAKTEKQPITAPEAPRTPVSYCSEPNCFVQAAPGEMWCKGHLQVDLEAFESALRFDGPVQGGGYIWVADAYPKQV